MLLEEGKASEFEITADISLNDILKENQGVVLSFIPDCDDFVSCIQMKSFRSAYGKIKEQRWDIVVVCGNLNPKLLLGSEDNTMPFHRVADPNASIAELYQVVGDFQLKNQPKKSLRRTFLINNQMNIIGFFEEIQPNHHIHDILEILEDVDGYLDVRTSRIPPSEESL